jgi:DNA-binding CsgD family transcriptional regulator
LRSLGLINWLKLKMSTYTQLLQVAINKQLFAPIGKIMTGITGGESQTSSSLSDRELQIVELVAAGLTNQEIAEKLDISKRTVDNHISNILTKTATGNRVALVRWALQWGKVCIDEVNCCTLPLSKDALAKTSLPVAEIAEPEVQSVLLEES